MQEFQPQSGPDGEEEEERPLPRSPGMQTNKASYSGQQSTRSMQPLVQVDQAKAPHPCAKLAKQNLHMRGHSSITCQMRFKSLMESIVC